LYLNELSKRIPADVNYLWTGATENPLIIDNVEKERIHKLVNQYPKYYSKDLNPFSSEKEDNLFKKYSPGRLRMSSIFEHFELSLPENHKNTEISASFSANTELHGELDKIKIATLANYLWNSTNYDPDFSLLCVLINRYGKEHAFNLIRFNELYQGIYEMCMKFRNRGYKKKYIRNADEYVNQLSALMDRLNSSFEHEVLLKELNEKVEEVMHFYNKSVPQ
jgi:hypothetical protein